MEHRKKTKTELLAEVNSLQERLAALEATQNDVPLIQDQRLLQTIVTMTPDIVYLYQIQQQKHLFINKEIGDILGYSTEELTRLGPDLILQSIHPADVPLVLDHVQLLASTPKDKLYTLEYRIKARDGNYLWFYVREQVFRRDADGKPKLLFGTIQNITERRQAEETLAYSEMMLRKAQAVAHLGIWWWDLRSNKLEWSDEMYRIFGIEKASFSGLLSDVIAQSIHPDDRLAVEIANNAVLTQGQGTSLESRVIWPDHSVHIVWTEGGEFLYDGDGHPVALMGIAQDITERKQAEQRLQRWELIFQHAGWGIVVGSQDGTTIEMMNPAFARMHGYTVDELIGQPILNLFAPEARAEFVEHIQLTHTRGHHAWESLHIRKDGSSFPVLVDATAVKNEAGEVQYRVVNLIDITERKQFEQALRDSEEKLRLFIEHAPASLAMFDRDMRYLAVSRRWLLDYQLGEQAIIGRSHYDVFPEIPEHWKEVHRRGLSGEVITNDDDSFVRVDGTVQWEQWEVRPWYTSTGTIGGIVIFSVNITERKRTEEELKQYRNHLEDLVARRTAQLHEANEQLIALSHIKDEFVSNVSHELRSPITSIVLRHDLLRRTPHKLDEHLDALTRETSRLSHTIEDLLRLSRLDQGRVEVALTPTDLNQIAAHLVHDREMQAEAKGLSLSFVGQPDLPLVLADAGLMEQVMSILLTNAIHYTLSGGRITISTHWDDSWIGFSVSDTGLGVLPEEQPHLFERFFQGQSNRTAKVRGTGLGLAIAKGIIELHHGRIGVESSGIPREGSTFFVWLPVVEV